MADLQQLFEADAEPGAQRQREKDQRNTDRTPGDED
jgi:hypothetical protein